MRLSITFAIILSLMVVLSWAAPTTQPRARVKRGAKGFVRIPIKHKFGEGMDNTVVVNKAKNYNSSEGLQVEQNAVAPATLKNHISYYSAEITVGTPGQTFHVNVDTGSSDLWVLDSSTGEDQSFDSSKSSSYNYKSGDFKIGYLQGSAEGDWITENVGIAGTTIKDQQMGLVKKQGAGKGILGVGLKGLESAKTKYPNVPQSLADQGDIMQNAYSLFLDDVEASSGSILFGAVQPSKWKGTLWTIPIKGENTISVEVNSIEIDGEEVYKGSFDTLLDSGTSLTYLEDGIVEQIAKKFNAKYSNEHKAYFTDERKDDDSVTYEFSGAKITVPSTEVLIDGKTYGGSNAPGKYMLTIVPYSQSSKYTILGDTFLRATYAVFDLDNKEVSLAQSSFDSSNGCVQVINGKVPGAMKAPNYHKGN